MRQCPECHRWFDGDICPVCEVPLLSEYRSEDGDDGIFAKPAPADEEIIVDNP